MDKVYTCFFSTDIKFKKKIKKIKIKNKKTFIHVFRSKRCKNHTLWGGMRLFLNQPIYAPSGQETPSDCTFTYTLTPKKKQQQQQIYCWSQLLIASLHEFIKRGSHTAISRKVVGKSARDNPERHCGWF